MARRALICRLRVTRKAENDILNETPEGAETLPLRDCSYVNAELRTKWANQVMEYFGEAKEPRSSIQSWDFIAGFDGSVQSTSTPRSEGSFTEGYPARFQIPPGSLDGLDQEEKVRRAERFAMASLLYEIMTGKEPFQEMRDEEVQSRFIQGEFPSDVADLPNVLFILSGWSAEFSQELTKRMEQHQPSRFQSMKDYARAHPVRTGIQIAGLGISILSLCAVPVLGAVGFAAGGPAAGSAATAWQASIGVVRAGSLFSWCQSAAMGGGALTGIQAAGAAGAVSAALTRVGDLPGLMETFKKGFRRPH